MDCCQCQGIESEFNRSLATRELQSYRRNGPSKATRIMTEILAGQGVSGLSLMDIGAGIGAVQYELFKAGIDHAIDVDASSAYLAVAQEEAQRQGVADRVDYRHGDFVKLAADIPEVDIVTLDRVVCCYPDMDALVGLSSAHARKFYALVFPRNSWWMKPSAPLINFGQWLRRSAFRFFLHPELAVDALVRKNGFEPLIRRPTSLIWQVAVYKRT
jgi:methyltransferase family protein